MNLTKTAAPLCESPLSIKHSQATADPAKTRERCRQAARRLAAKGQILITQYGEAVDPSFAKGVMELRFPS